MKKFKGNQILPEDSKRSIQKYIHVGILTAFIPAFSYLTAYFFERGFCGQLQIPLSFIEIGINEVLKVIVLIIPLILFLFFGIVLTIYVRILKNPVFKILSRSIFPLFLFFLMFAFSGLSLVKVIIGFLIFWFIFIGSDFIFPLFSKRKFRGYYKRTLESYLESDKKTKDLFDKISDLFIEQFGILTYTIIFFLSFVLIFFVGDMGRSYARNKRSFMIIKSSPELVILRRYSSSYICAPFDREKKEFKKKFYLKTGDKISEEGFEIVIEDIGPLKLPKEKNISPQE